MAINYTIVKRKNPLKKEAQELYYLNAKGLGCMKDEDFIEDMVKNTSLTRSEAETALNYLTDSLFKYLSLGFTVRLGKLGYFKITIKSKGSKTKQEATKDKLVKIAINFIPNKKTAHVVSGFQIEPFPK